MIIKTLSRSEIATDKLFADHLADFYDIDGKMISKKFVSA